MKKLIIIGCLGFTLLFGGCAETTAVSNNNAAIAKVDKIAQDKIDKDAQEKVNKELQDNINALVNSPYNKKTLDKYIRNAINSEKISSGNMSYVSDLKNQNAAQLEYLKAIIEIEKQQLEEQKKQTKLLESINEKTKK